MNKQLVYGLLALMCFYLTGCVAVYDKAEMKFQAAAYDAAIPLYKEALAKNPKLAKNINFKLAECYRLSNRPALAEPFYAAALTNKTAEPLAAENQDKLKFYYGYALAANAKYSEATEQFQEYVNTGTKPRLQDLAKAEIESLQKAEEIKKMTTHTRIEHCGNINTNASDFSSALINGQLAFTSARRMEKVYEGTGKGFHDVYYANFSNDKTFADITAAGLTVNTDGAHEASATFSPDGKSMIFARSGNGKKESDQEVSLYVSTFDGTAWTEAKPLEALNSDKWDGCPSFSPDGKTLFFASNRDGDLDIFSAKVNPDGTFGPPSPLDKAINTPANEMFPYLAPNGKFFFASDGHHGLGGLDIFVQEKNKVRNVGTPINSPADDFGILYKNDSVGYFTSNRSDAPALGDDDIYYFINDSVNFKFVDYYLQGITYFNTFEDKTRKVLSNTTLRFKDSNKNLLATATSNDAGKFKFDTALNMKMVYSIEAEKDGYLPKTESFSTIGKAVDVRTLPKKYNTIVFDTDLTLTMNFLKPTNDKLPPEIEILYEFDKTRLTEDSKKLLDQFVGFLNEFLAVYPDVVIELGSHTDERGSAKYNERLADGRAKSAVDYLLQKGVSSTNIAAKGYGEYELKVKKAKTEPQHQENRRTTVKVFKKSEYKPKVVSTK
ncbi:MAG: hypothetical protein EAZ57_03990 [Cytophagales bacterium]|nr:MAG: hypothetical protein EAZ67_05005 [Cytophagales bacterium]TAF61370.1 MAG: hypothetical protein EAZ57_03990 [Cytophagales bacterium]